MLSIGVLLLGAVTAGAAISIKFMRNPKPTPGFKIITKQTFSPASPNIPLPEAAYVITVRHQKFDGTWKMVRTGYKSDGAVIKEDMSFGQPGRGVFQVDPQTRSLNFLSPMETNPSETPVYDPRQDSHFVREETVQGYSTFVLRFTEDDGSGYIDLYLATDFGNYPIKEISVSQMGTATTEPVKIEVKEPDAKEFSYLPNWPVKYEHFEEKIQSMEQAGRHESAEAMRQQLRQRLQQKPDKQ